MPSLKKGVANQVYVYLALNGTPQSGITGLTFYLVDSAGNVASSSKIGPSGNTDWTLTEVTGTVTVSTTTCTATTELFPGQELADGTLDGSMWVGKYISDGTNQRQITAWTSSTVVTIASNVSWTSQAVTIKGMYLGTMPQAAARLMNRVKTYRVVPYKDGTIEGAEEIFSVQYP